MKRLRLVLVTRRFWPLVGGAEMMMANLAAALQQSGHQATILTAAWHPDWPVEIQHRGVPVYRLPQSPQRWLGTLQYMRGMGRWLRKHRDRYDVAYVSMLKHDAAVAVRFGQRLHFPAIVRAEGSGPTGDAAWQKRHWLGRWMARNIARAAAIVAPSPAIQQELAAAGYDVQRLHFIPNGVNTFPERTPESRTAAREALGTAHPVLSLGRDTRLAVYTGRLAEEKGLLELVDAWADVLKQRTNTRLWLVGEGPLRDQLAERIERHRIRGRCVLVGAFDSVEELLMAADLFVLPSHEEGMSVALLEAMAAALPIVATDIPGNRPLITHNEHGLLVPPSNRKALAEALARLLDGSSPAAELGAAARRKVHAKFALSKMVDRHVELFEQCLRDLQRS